MQLLLSHNQHDARVGRLFISRPARRGRFVWSRMFYQIAIVRNWIRIFIRTGDTPSFKYIA